MNDARAQMSSRWVWRVIRAMSPKGPEDLLRLSLETRWLRLHQPDPNHWGIAEWARDRMGFARAVLLKPLRWRRQGERRLTSRVLIADRMAKSERARESRSYFVAHAFAENADVFQYDDTFPAVTRPRTGAAWRLWFRALGWWLGSWFDFSRASYRWVGLSIALAMDYEVVSGSCERLYVFGVANPIHYLAAAYAYEVLGLDVRLVDSGSPMHRVMRAVHMDCVLVLCNRIQEHELAYYAAQGINRARGMYVGTENALDLEGLEPTPARYHLAYYSSGMWARKGGLLQTTDIESIRRGDHAGNPYTAKTQEILETMAALARERGWKFKIYPHPYERMLMSEHGIDPPYLRLVDGQNVVFDSQGANSRRLMGEALVAVSLQSTLIFERLDAGFESSYVYYWGDPERDVFDPAASGPFGNRCFRSMDELRGILVRDVEAREAQVVS